MSKVNFYSAEQVTTLENEINSGKRVCEILKQYSKEWKRPASGLAYKLNTIRKKLNVSTPIKTGKKRGRPAKNTNPSLNTATKGIVLRSGFVFDFKPQRAEMHSDHVRLYF